MGREINAKFDEITALAEVDDFLDTPVTRYSTAVRYRFASASHAGVEYEIAADGADVMCTCPGFEYRGQCRHSRDVKAAVATGRPAPDGLWRARSSGDC